MKINLIFCMLIFPALPYAQQPVFYQVKNRPVIISGITDNKILTRVPKNKLLTFISYNDSCDCFLVKYKKLTGVVFSEVLLNDAGTPGDSGQIRFIAELRSRLNPADQKLLIKRKADFIRKYGYSQGIQVSEGKIWIGMSIDMALDSRGIPYKVNRSMTEWGNREQWIYSDTYLYFENGILSEIFIIKRSTD